MKNVDISARFCPIIVQAISTVKLVNSGLLHGATLLLCRWANEVRAQVFD